MDTLADAMEIFGDQVQTSLIGAGEAGKELKVEFFPLLVRSTGTHNFEVTLLDEQGQPYSDEEGVVRAKIDWNVGTGFEELSLLDIARRSARSGGDEVYADQHLARLGIYLFKKLFVGRVADEFAARRQRADQVYLHLYLPSALSEMPWEYLSDGDKPVDLRFLLAGGKVLLSRGSKVLAKPPTLEPIPTPLRLLVIVSNPPDLSTDMQLDSLRELVLMRKALAPLIQAGKLELYELDEASPQMIGDAMQCEPHIIHFTGHSNYFRQRGGVLVIEDGNDHQVPINAVDAANLLVKPSVRLITLNSCSSGAATALVSEPTMPSVGAALLRAGTPAVVAMQDRVRDDHASEWSANFYTSLLQRQQVAEAMSLARDLLRLKGYSDWGMPVLLTEQPTIELFNTNTMADHESASTTQPVRDAAGAQRFRFPGLVWQDSDAMFVGRQLEQRRLRRMLLADTKRVAIILGAAQVGKTS